MRSWPGPLPLILVPRCRGGGLQEAVESVRAGKPPHPQTPMLLQLLLHLWLACRRPSLQGPGLKSRSVAIGLSETPFWPGLTPGKIRKTGKLLKTGSNGENGTNPDTPIR